MTRSARGPVALDTNAEIINEVFLTYSDGLTPSGKEDGVAFPLEVRSVDDLLSRIGMTFQAGACDSRSVLQGTRDEPGVVGMREPLGQFRLGIHWAPFGFRKEVEDGDDEKPHNQKGA